MTTELRARTLARKHAVHGVAPYPLDDAGALRLARALGHAGLTTPANRDRRLAWLEAYHEAYDRAASGGLTPAELRAAQQWNGAE
jgi:hypothetical protein